MRAAIDHTRIALDAKPSYERRIGMNFVALPPREADAVAVADKGVRNGIIWDSIAGAGRMIRLRKHLEGVALAAALAALGAGAGFAEEAAPVPELRPGVLQGYLAKEALPDSAGLLPPPPSVGSAAAALDQDVARATLALRDSARWKLAALDANLRFPDAAGTFSCALGAPITEQDTPRLYVMLRRVMTDAGYATFAAKEKYQHARPFMLDDRPICSPDAGKSLRAQGSYPSGHTSIGWAWALVLAEAAPDRGEAILARGLAFGENRLVCNVHWESDVIEGRTIGAATVARLHDEPVFQADLAAAKAEISAGRAKGLPPQRDCKFEAEALAQTVPDAP